MAGAKSRKPADRVQGKDQEREREREKNLNYRLWNEYDREQKRR